MADTESFSDIEKWGWVLQRFFSSKVCSSQNLVGTEGPWFE